MIKQQDTSPVEVNLDRFTTFNKQIFHDEDTIPDTYTPLTTPSDHHISTDELTTILRYKYKADKSRGLSKLPPQLLKFLGATGISSLASFLNASAIDHEPPASWRTAKIIPLYKGKGDATIPENYRSIAIPPPFAKVFMATINARLTTTADTLKLHAPTQAGFRAHHTTMEQALILQTIIQHSLKTKRKLGMAFIDLRRAYDSINREKLW
jgi:Reverse transcriptase (RNA-dependent DNA polymerase)